MMELLPTTVTHLSGPVIECNGRVIQRCCSCGLKLIDSGKRKLTKKQLREFPIFPIGQFIHYETEEKYHVMPFNKAPVFPPDFCIDLVEP